MKTKKMYLTPRLRSTEMMTVQIMANSTWLDPGNAKEHDNNNALWYNERTEATTPAPEKNGLEW